MKSCRHQEGERRMKKSIWILVLVLCLALCGLAAAETVASGTYGTLDWSLDHEGLLEISGTGAMEDFISGQSSNAWRPHAKDIKKVVIGEGITNVGNYAFYACQYLTDVTLPSTITSIGSNAFYSCSEVTSITIPDMVTNIGDRAFMYCNGLSSIHIPVNVAVIGEYAFMDCRGLESFTVDINNPSYSSDEGILYNKNKTVLIQCPSKKANVTVPQTVISIGENAFYNNEQLTSIIIPDNVVSIGKACFERCINLSTVSLGNGLTDIGDSAFHYCTKLTSIVIPDNVTSLGEYAFYSDQQLSSVTLGSGITKINNSVFRDCVKLTEITIPAGVTEIDEYAFYNCFKLETVHLPNNIVSIGNSAFQYCSELTEINIPQSTRSIGDSSFYMCAALSEVDLSQVETIGDQAFHGCTLLNTVATNNLLNSAGQIGGNAFTQCAALKSIALGPDASFQDNTFDADIELIISFNNTVAIQKAVSLSLAFKRYCGNPFYIVDENLKLIAYTNENSSSITVPAPIAAIGNDVFKNHTEIVQVTIPETVTAIGMDAFYYTGLTSVVIPDSVRSLGTTAFCMCKNLESITFGTGAAVLPTGVAGQCDVLTSVTIPEGVTTIKNLAFHGDKQLTELTLPNTLTTIEQNAFGMTKIAELRLPDGITTITNAFDEMASLMDVYVPGRFDCTDFYTNTKLNDTARVHTAFGSTAAKTLGRAFVPTNYEGLLVEYTGDGTTDSWKVVGTYMPFTELVLPAEITAVGSEAFLNHTTLTSVTLNDGLVTIEGRAFEGANLAAIAIPASVTNIGDAAFLDNPLTSVTFADNSSLTAIGADAFRNTDLTAVSFPANLTEIGNRAFLECDHLASITLPTALEAIGEQAFQETLIEELNLPDQLLTIGSSAFQGTHISGTIAVPASVTYVGGNAFGNTGVTVVHFLGANTQLGGAVTNTGVNPDTAVMYAAPVSATAKSVSRYYDSFVDIDDEEWTYVWAFRDGNVHWKQSYTDAYYGRQMTDADKELLVALAYSSTNQSNLTILSGVNVLNEYLLEKHYEIKTISLPNSLRIIDNYALSHVEKLTGVIIPEGTLYLGTRAFEHCKDMTSVIVPDSLNRLYDYVFDGCLQVPGITLPDNMTYVGDCVLGESDVAGDRTFTVNIDSQTVRLLGRYNFFYDRQHPEYRYRWLSESYYDDTTGNWVDRSGLELNRYVGNAKEIIVDSRVISIGSNAFCWYNTSTGNYFRNTTLEKIVFPEGLTHIGYEAFSNAAALAEISLPSTLKTIDSGAFAYCPITSLTIPDSVTSIQSSAFYNTKITEVTVKDDGIVFGSDVFSLPTKVYCGLDSYSAHRLSDHNTAFFANDLDTEHSALEDCALRYIRSDIGDGTETLRLMGYYGTKKFITLYEKIESVQDNINLSGARVIADINSKAAHLMSDTHESYESSGHEVYHPLGFTTSESDDYNYAWIKTGEDTDAKLTIVQYYGNAERLTELPTIAERMDYYVFWDTANPPKLVCKPLSPMGQLLNSMPDTMNHYDYYDPDDEGLHYFGLQLYQYTGTATEVTIAEGINEIYASAFLVYDGINTWVPNATVNKVVFPTTLNHIGDQAFAGMSQLDEVVFQSGLSGGIDHGAFKNTGIRSIHIPGDVYAIRNQAFYSMNQLESIVIDGCTNYLDNYSIQSNNNLKSLCLMGGVTSFADYSVSYNSNLSTVKLGEGTTVLERNGSFEVALGADIWLPASLSNIEDRSISIYGYGDITNKDNGLSLATIHAPLSSYAAHWASDKLGWFVADDNFGYAYDNNGNMVLVDYTGTAEAAAPNGSIEGISRRIIKYEEEWNPETGSYNQLPIYTDRLPRLIADTSSVLAKKISENGFNFTPFAESEWDYRWINSKLYGAKYYGSQKEFTALPAGMDGILTGALPDDVRFICNRNDALAHLVEGFYETSTSEWKLRWNDTVLTLVKYTGTETELTTFPAGVSAVDEGAFDQDVAFICAADSDMAKAVGAAGYYFYTDSKHSLQLQWSGSELTLLSGTASAGEVAVPNGVTEITDNAFMDNANLTAITIPGSVKKIGSYAFRNCSALKTVNMANSLETVGDQAFSYCTLLTELRLPDSVTTIGSNLVSGTSCNLYLPDGITSAAYQQDNFTYCRLFVHADSATARALGSRANKSNWYWSYSDGRFRDPDDNYIYAWLDGKLYLMQGYGYGQTTYSNGTVYPDDTMFRSDIYGIKDNDNYASGRKTIVLPATLRDLWSESGSAFFGGETQSITFPEGLTTIPANTDTSYSLSAVVIPRSVISINDNAFGESLMVVYGYAGTEAEAYANRKGIDFVDLDGDIEDDAVITPDQQNTVLHVGETVDLHDLVTILPALSTPYALSGSCANSAVLTVQGDRVTAVAPGTASLNVWITDHDITEISMSVTVYNTVADFDVPEDSYIDINNGSKYFSVTNVTPSGSDPNFVWTDSTNGYYGTGESVWIYLSSKVNKDITVTSHNGISKTFRITGYQTLGNLTITANTTMKVGQVATPTVKIRVDSSTRTNPTGLYTLTSSDENVIAIGEKGSILAVGPGTATVTAQHRQDMDGSKAKSVTITVTEPTVLRLPSALKTIEEEAFEGIVADKVIIPAGTVSIGRRAFAGSGISYIVIPASVTSIASDAFSGVSDLTVECAAGSAAEAFAQANGYHIVH